MSISELMFIVFLLNLPFGYMRSRAVPFSARWMLAIHIPIPFVIALRLYCGFGWKAVPLLVLADVAGQLAGGYSGRIIKR